jgi:glyoxylase-like metal-dependent hydrolase (beta-lactamase superfamily II)
MCLMRQIVDGVWELPFGYVHAHLVATDDGLALIDTGLPGRADRIEAMLDRVGRRLGEVRTVLLTHRHPDHIGSLAELRRRTDLEVVAHRADVPVIEGREPQPLVSLMMRLTAPFMKADGAQVDRLLDGDGPTGVPAITAVHTPGHTGGHLSFLLERDGGVLFVGDAATTRRGKVRNSPKMVSDDPAAVPGSIRRLAEFDFEYAVFGHGAAVTGRAIDKFKDYAGRQPA